MWKSKRRRDDRGTGGFTATTRPRWGHPARHEADWPAQRNRELAELLAVTGTR